MSNRVKEIVGNSKLLFFFRVFAEKNREAIFLLKRLSSGQSDWRKIEPVLRVEVHALEKGMSIGDVRPGFGKAKAEEFMTHLQRYYDVGGRKDFVNECCSILNKYIRYNENLGAEMSEVERKFLLFCDKNQVKLYDFGGVKEIEEQSVKESLKKDFSFFSQTRYAVRDFGDSIITMEQINEALKLAEKTPSACNRQSWKIHVYSGNDVRSKMFNLQGGNKGFSDDMQYAILICGDMNYYRFYELSQVYVDGGLYAMNLMYALHYCGAATIPLTMSKRIKKLRKLSMKMNLPESEMPILLIGVGSYKNRFKVAKSERIPFNEYTNIE